MISQKYAFKTLGAGDNIHASAHWPQGKQKQLYSIALAFHGGGFVVGSRDMVPTEQIQYLIESGFVVVSADYRLCPQISLYDGPIEDAKDAYKWCKQSLPSLLKEQDIEVDPARIVVFGHSAGGCLALHTGTLADPPLAILDFYGVKYTTDKFWFEPLPALAKIPTLDEAFLNQVYQEPVISNTVLSLERAAASAARPKAKGRLPPPDLSKPRNAWLFVNLKLGTHFRSIVKDDDFERVDPVHLFSSKFPPTFFIHGTADDMVLPKFSEMAHAKLQGLEVETRFVLVEGKSHGFDVGVGPGDDDFTSIRAGLDFLIEHK